MKRTAVITLLGVGAGALAIAAAFEEPCDPQGNTAKQIPAVQAGQVAPKPQSCSSGSHGGHGSFFSRVARGGFGNAGRGFGG